MSDFDDLLERLLLDPGFAARLAADPDAALGGYRLTAEEAALLRSQVSTEAGGHRQVESRTNKSSLFGLLTPLSEGGAQAPGGGAQAPGGAPVDAPGAPVQTGFGPAEQTGFGGAEQTGFGPAVRGGFGPVDQPGPAEASGFGPAVRGGFGPVEHEQTGLEPAPAPPPPAAAFLPPRLEHYHTRVDVDGDGRWDAHTYRFRPDGGVDILVDADHDGRVDFVGHDDNADGLIDSADLDTNHDGRLDTRLVDDNGDGWLDRRLPGRPLLDDQSEVIGITPPNPHWRP